MRSRLFYYSVFYPGLTTKKFTQEELNQIIDAEGITLRAISMKDKEVQELIKNNPELDEENVNFQGRLCYGRDGTLSFFPTLFYNQDLSPEKIFFIKTHELCHHLLHVRMNAYPQDSIQKDSNLIDIIDALKEIEADVMTMHFLVPEKSIFKKFGEKALDIIKQGSLEDKNNIKKDIVDFLESEVLTECRKTNREMEKISDRAKINLEIRALKFLQAMEEEILIFDKLKELNFEELKEQNIDILLTGIGKAYLFYSKFLVRKATQKE